MVIQVKLFYFCCVVVCFICDSKVKLGKVD